VWPPATACERPVWALTPRAGMRTGEEEGRWWQSPVVLGVLVLLLILVLYVIFQ
jgi:SSS family solute:Na+ symporter